MTLPRLAALSLALLAAGFAAGRARRVGAAAPAAEREVLYWVDPMHPAYRSDAPGTAPDCGMKLEPVYADGGPAPAAGGPPRPAGTVTVGAELRRLQGVRVQAVAREARTHALRLFGRVVPDEQRVHVLNAAMEGSIRELSDATTGSVVRKGQRLGAFFSAELRAPLQAYVTALDVLEQDAAARARNGVTLAAGATPGQSARFAVERLHALGMSWQQLEEMRATRRLPLTVDIRSPADGVVLSRGVSRGQRYDRGAEWFRIAALDRVWILADLAVRDAALARPGARAQVTIPGRPGALPAVVSDVPPAFDAEARTLKLRLEVENPGAILRPEMLVDVALEVTRAPAVVVPADAVLDAGLRRTVFVEAAEGVYAPRAVETGWRFGPDVEIVRGLAPGERVVAAGTFLVDSESQLRAAAEGFRGLPARDPVCGMEVDEARARAAGRTVEHDGRPWFFCSDGCKAGFQADPARFAGHAHAASAGTAAGPGAGAGGGEDRVARGAAGDAGDAP